MKKIDIHDIKVSSKLDGIVKGAVKEGYRKNNNRKYRTGIVVASLAIVLATGLIRPEFVSATVDKIKNSIGNFALNKMEYSVPEEYKTVIGKTVEDKGIKVTLDEFYIDKNIIMMTTNLDSRERNDYAQFIGPEIYIDGKLVEGSGFSFSEEKSGAGHTGVYNEDGTIDILTIIYNENLDIKSKGNIEVKYGEIGVTNTFDMDKNIAGDWQYNFNVDVNDFKDKVAIKDINKTISVNGEEININEISISPNIVILNNECKEDVRYVIEDEEGNQYDSLVTFGFGQEERAIYLMNLNDNSKIKIIPKVNYIENDTELKYDEAITLEIK